MSLSASQKGQKFAQLLNCKSDSKLLAEEFTRMVLSLETAIEMNGFASAMPLDFSYQLGFIATNIEFLFFRNPHHDPEPTLSEDDLQAVKEDFDRIFGRNGFKS